MTRLSHAPWKIDVHQFPLAEQPFTCDAVDFVISHKLSRVACSYSSPSFITSPTPPTALQAALLPACGCCCCECRGHEGGKVGPTTPFRVTRQHGHLIPAALYPCGAQWMTAGMPFGTGSCALARSEHGALGRGQAICAWGFSGGLRP